MKIRRIAIAAVSGALLASCASTPLPPPLTPDQGARLSGLPLPDTVAVAPCKWPAHSDALTRALASSGVFQRVAPLGGFSGKPDWIAAIGEPVAGNATLPVATFATLGLVPAMTDETHGLRFTLAPASGPGRKVTVDATYHGETTLGLAAVALNASGNRTSGDPLESERFRRMLAYRTLRALRP